MLSQGHVLEHGSTRGGRWLRANRLRVALGVAIAEGLLIVFGAIEWWMAVVVALAAIAFYVFIGRGVRAYTIQQASWTAAASQVLVVAVPVLVVLVSWLAILALAIIAVIALVVLFSDRR